MYDMVIKSSFVLLGRRKQMKKWLSLLLAFCLLLPWAGALAESEEQQILTFGEGQNSALCFAMFTTETYYQFVVNSDKELVLDALLENGLVSGQTESWGYYVTSVLGVEAAKTKEISENYEGYFRIFMYDADAEDMVELETPLEQVKMSDVTMLIFILQ